MSRDSGEQWKAGLGLSDRKSLEIVEHESGAREAGEPDIQASPSAGSKPDLSLATAADVRSAGRRQAAFKSAWQALVLAVLRVLMAVSRFLPLRVFLWLGSLLGSLGYLFAGRYRRVGLKNLRLVYGDELSQAQRRRITRAVFVNFGKSVMEFVSFAAMRPQTVGRIVRLEPEDKARIDRALAGGKGLIAFSAHFGNFELAARRFALDGYDFIVVVRNDANTGFADTINRFRRAGGYGVIGRGDAARPMLRHLKVGGILAVLPDQKSEDLFLPFLGQLSGTVAGPAVLALRTGAPLVPLFCIRQPDDTHRIEVGEPIDTSATQDADADIRRVMTDVNRVIGDAVRKHPEQWLWIHDRWKVVPPPAAVAEWEAKRGLRSSAC